MYSRYNKIVIGGKDAGKKAKAVGEAIINKTKKIFAMRNLDDYIATNLEVLGTEWSSLLIF